MKRTWAGPEVPAESAIFVALVGEMKNKAGILSTAAEEAEGVPKTKARGGVVVGQNWPHDRDGDSW